jgi:hypothetical protein
LNDSRYERQKVFDVARGRVRDGEDFLAAERFARIGLRRVNRGAGIGHVYALGEFLLTVEQDLQGLRLARPNSVQLRGVEALLLDQYVVKARAQARELAPPGEIRLAFYDLILRS